MNENLKKNIHRLYLAQAISLVSLCLLFFPVINLAAAIAVLVAAVIGIIGLVSLRHEHPDYMNAVYCWLGSILIGLFQNSMTSSALPYSLVEIVSTALSVGVIYFVIRATDSFLIPLGREDAIALGGKALRCQVIMAAVSAATELLPLLMTGTTLICALVGFAVAIWAILADMKYLKTAEAAI